MIKPVSMLKDKEIHKFALLFTTVFINSFMILSLLGIGYARVNAVKSDRSAFQMVSGLPESSQAPLSGGENGITWFISENHSSAFINPYLVLSFTCDRSVNILIAIAGIEGATTNKITPESVIKPNFNAGSHEVVIPIHMTLDALPGEYIYLLSVEFRESSNNSFITVAQVEKGRIIYLGGFLMLIFLIISIVSITLLILSREENLKKEPSPTAGAEAVYVPGEVNANMADKENDASINMVSLAPEDVKPGFIKCPDCKKDIPEGSSFCPECGFHIPKFLRVGGAQE